MYYFGLILLGVLILGLFLIASLQSCTNRDDSEEEPPIEKYRVVRDTCRDGSVVYNVVENRLHGWKEVGGLWGKCTNAPFATLEEAQTLRDSLMSAYYKEQAKQVVDREFVE